MNDISHELETLYLEDFDIEKLSRDFPNYRIGVKTTAIYAQMAKYHQNPKRIVQSRILHKALRSARVSKHLDSKYIVMELSEVITCFGESLKKLPKTTFTQYDVFEQINK